MKTMKKYFKAAISLVLALVLTFTTCTGALAASSKKTYIKDMVISYGKTADEAKKWLTDNGYTVLNYDLNEGADDMFSTKRAVYIGYTTTEDPEEAITDMRLMNMKGGYSVQDYQMLLDEQKADIRAFIDNFIVAIKEYRENYKNGQVRAVAAHDMLNMMLDDDTGMKLGDLFLNKIKEEYTDEEWSALSEEEQGKAADMTTILMQANGTAVLAMEQLIAQATDDSDTLWSARYAEAETYDEMLEELMKGQNLTVSEAEKQLAAEYDIDAKAIASKLADYRDYLKCYTEAGIDLTSSEEEIEAYQKEHEDFSFANWTTAGTHYEVLSALTNDDISLLELINGEDFDVEEADRYLLYPFVASLTAGQRACLDFLPMYQIVALGINNDASMETAMEELKTNISDEEGQISVYQGVDRSIFGSSVALTGEAYKLQSSSGKEIEGYTSRLSTSSIVLYALLGVSVVATIACLVKGFSQSASALAGVENAAAGAAAAANQGLGTAARTISTGISETSVLVKTNIRFFEHAYKLKEVLDGDYLDMAMDVLSRSTADKIEAGRKAANAVVEETNVIFFDTEKTTTAVGQARSFSNVWRYASIGMVAVSAILLGFSIWSTYNDMKKYYNTELTPIPMHMVAESVNDDDEKVYTYYTVVKCNRVEAGMVTDATKLLEDYGDINGDVGRQWVALYTTKDSTAGNPVTTELKVQYKNTSLPSEECTALSMFDENAAQNLTNEQAGYTYDDDMDGIYMFFNTDKNAFVGSVFMSGTYSAVGAAVAVVIIAILLVIGKVVRNKKARDRKENA